MAIAVVASGSIGSVDGGNTAVSAGANTTGANLIVVQIGIFQNAVVLSDSKGNTWTALTEWGAPQGSRLYYCASPTVGAGHTFTATSSGGASDPTLSFVAVSGAAATPFEAETGGSSSGASFQPGSITPAENGDLIVTGVTCYVGDTLLINSGFSAASTNFASGQNLGGGLGWLIQGTAAAVNPTWSWSTSTGNCASGIAIFKVAAVTCTLVLAGAVRAVSASALTPVAPASALTLSGSAPAFGSVFLAAAAAGSSGLALAGSAPASAAARFTPALPGSTSAALAGTAAAVGYAVAAAGIGSASVTFAAAAPTLAALTLITPVVAATTFSILAAAPAAPTIRLLSYTAAILIGDFFSQSDPSSIDPWGVDPDETTLVYSATDFDGVDPDETTLVY